MRNLLTLIFVVCGLGHAAAIYSVVDLGGSAGSGSVGYAVNASGMAAGWAMSGSGDNHAITSGGSAHDLNPSGASESYAYGINSSGQVAGTGYFGGQAHGWVLNGSSLFDLGANTFGLAINDSGVVAGGNGHAFTDANGAIHDFGTLAGGSWSAAYSINSAGQVAGYGDIANGVFRAFVSNANGGLRALGTLGGLNSYAAGINDQGQVVGHASKASGFEDAFLWSAGAGMIDLGTLGGTGSYAYDINNHGDVVGYSWLSSGPDSHAFIFRNGVLYDLNSLIPANSGWELLSAFGINDAGQIVGDGMYQGQQHAFRLDFATQLLAEAAVPEPATIGLIGVSLLAGSLRALWVGLKRRGSRNP